MEVLEDIFQYLAYEDLKSIALTCRIFRLAAQYLIFHDLSIPLSDEYRFDINERIGRVKPEWYDYRRQMQIERHEFYGTESVASMVRSCKMFFRTDPAGELHYPPKSRKLGLGVGPGQNKVWNPLDILPNLKRLQALHLGRFNIPIETFFHILTLPELTSLCLEYCTCDGVTSQSLGPPQLPPQIPLKRLTLKSNSSMIPVYLANIVDPNYIEHLTILAPPGPDDPYSMLIPKGIMPHLKTLCLSSSATSSASFIPLLSNCPSLENLSIACYGFTYNPLVSFPPQILPLLKSYHGPHCYAPLLARDRKSLHRVCMWDSRKYTDPTFTTKDVLDFTIMDLKVEITSYIQELSVQVSYISGYLMSGICRLKQLRKLVVWKGHPTPYPQKFNTITRMVSLQVQLSSLY
jgi:hypothetical protein